MTCFVRKEDSTQTSVMNSHRQTSGGEKMICFLLYKVWNFAVSVPLVLEVERGSPWFPGSQLSLLFGPGTKIIRSTALKVKFT